MNTRVCTDCRIPFALRFGYETRCWPCYKVFKRGTASQYEPAREAVRYIEHPELPRVDEWREMLPRLLRLAHPDRHGNSQMATTATQWLLAQRQRFGGAV